MRTYRVDRPWSRFFHRKQTALTGAALLASVAALAFVWAVVFIR